MSKKITRETKKPTGLAIARDGWKFTFSWKIGDADYKDGQWLQVAIKDSALGWFNWQTIKIGKTTTKKTIGSSDIYALQSRLWHPAHEAAYFRGIRFRVKGNRQEYSTGTGKKKVTHNFTTSDWAVKEWLAETPKNPSVGASVSTAVSNSTTFSWNTDADTKGKHMFARNLWQSKVLVNSTENDGSKAWGSKDMLAGSWLSDTTGASGTRTITEQSETINTTLNSYTRWVRVLAQGARGNSEWKYARHIYALPYQAVITEASATKTSAGTTNVSVKWVSESSKKGGGNHPIDRTVVEYVIAKPEAGMKCPAGVTWTTAGIISDTAAFDGIRFSIDGVIEMDNVLFVRVNNEHDVIEDYGITRGIPTIPEGSIGKLSMPTFSVDEIEPSIRRAKLIIDDIPDVDDARIAVYMLSPTNEKDGWYLIGATTTHSQSVVYIEYPAIEGTPQFAIRAVVGDINVELHTVTNILMQSDLQKEGGFVPKAPQNVKCVPTINDGIGTVFVQWDWAWDEADGAILSWSDHSDAWMSTDEPEEYELSKVRTSQWNISNLETGKTWYVRVRLYKGDGDERQLGEWSELSEDSIVNLKSAPNTPTLALSKYIVTEGEMVEASWAYSSTDGTGQAQADICLATISDNEITYSKPILKTGSAQYVTIDTASLGFTNGNSYNLCVRVVSASGETSDAWSAPATLIVAEKPSITIDSIDGMRDETIIDDVTYDDTGIEGFALDVNLLRAKAGVVPSSLVITENGEQWDIDYGGSSVATVDDLESWGIFGVTENVTVSNIQAVTHEVKTLYKIPLEVTATGAGETGKTSVSIRRKDDYRLERPDGTDYNGYQNEVIVAKSSLGESAVSIETEDLVGTLDDGETYLMTVYVTDTYGQVAYADDIEFEVHWDLQAKMPEAEVRVEDGIAIIKPIAPDGADADDRVDIYRITADRPELIYPNAEFGVEYVDPFPAIGEHGGHRIVYKTKYGDFITATNERAILDLGEDDGDIIEADYGIINFGGEEVHIYYNVDVSNQWQKDFQETRYLGGSIQGDWNVGVSRSSSVSLSMINLLNEDDVLKMKELAMFTSVCHLRTVDGSSFACDIQVSEDRPHEKRNMVTSFSLSAVKIDNSGYDGMTLDEWREQNGLE